MSNEELQTIKRGSLLSPAGVPFASPQCAQICAALADAQGAFRTPKRTKTATVKMREGGSYKFSYAPLDEMIDAIKEGLAANGLSRQQYLIRGDDSYFVRTVIWHSSGEWIASDYPVMYSKEGAQGFAGGVTYARRYGLSLALGLAPEDDDDGATAEGHEPVIESKPPRKPKQPAASVMQQPYDPQTGEVIADPEPPADAEYAALMAHDGRLMAAAQGRAGLPAMLRLEEEWQRTPAKFKTQLKAALDRRYKHVAELVDAAQPGPIAGGNKP